MKFIKILSLSIITTTILWGAGCSTTKEEEDANAANRGTVGIPDAGIDDPDVNFDNKDSQPTDFTADKDFQNQKNDWVAIPGLNFPTVYFAYNQNRIGVSERSKLEKTANYMLKYATVSLVIEGHCDERGSEEYNRALGERRAIAVKDYLLNLGVPESRLRTISYGEERPVDASKTINAYSQNRRAELVPHRAK